MSDEIKVEESAVEKEKSFDEMLEETLKTIYNGDKVTGTVVAITGTEVSVDLGTKYSGFIPTTEFTDDGVKVEDVLKVGDSVEAVVVRVNDVEGTAMLSKKRLDAAKVWTDVEAAVDDGTVMEGVVTEENKGGIVVSVKGVRVFVPASQTDLPREAELSQLLKKTVRLKITEVNKARKRVVGSIRRVAQAERRERTENIWNEIEVGKRYHGVVKSLTSYGAFVDIGGIDGMVHVSELSWGRIHHPSEVVSVGDEIDVYVVNFDRDKRKISLGYKDADGNPWAQFTSKYEVGSIASVTIVKLMPFGAFAEILPGVDGLIHISQIANRRIGKPDDVLTVGDVVDAKITAIDEDKHKVSLSIRALSEPAPAPAAEDDFAAPQHREDALVYEVSATGEATGIAPDAE
ncbi:MAG: 30S ribosomal protein S1 [Oscillospiraceae bacterium]|nr:30S ribosomal protein S1 [Oscillospiraceae bacterium]